jgi:hypothetical protein
MRRFILLAVLGSASLMSVALQAQEEAEKLAAQKKAARDNWALLEAGEAASQETEHLFILAPKSMERRLKEVGGNLEKSYGMAAKAVLTKPKEELWAGKLTVYLIPEREQFTTFARRVEKRRLEEDESGSHSVDGDLPHAAAGPARVKGDPSLEHQAAAQIAAAILQQKAGAKVPLPEWLVLGFGRATVWRVAPTDKTVIGDRRLVKSFIVGKKRTAADVWNGTLESEEAGVLRASLAEFLAYGPGAAKFPALLSGFKPAENQESRTIAQALESAKLDPKAIEARWGAWALGSGK